jgi:hypothetical protein
MDSPSVSVEEKKSKGSPVPGWIVRQSATVLSVADSTS